MEVKRDPISGIAQKVNILNKKNIDYVEVDEHLNGIFDEEEDTYDDSIQTDPEETDLEIGSGDVYGR